ncbi:TrmB family transcriptional regulator [Ktedonosporobacter rubrisoli]|uniref:TrmB family transcriptional regulator n=1 Tax=Ktedonosporobacter rubrisoli TaxID=2509675 RepID=A0A4P6JTY8_KTERU|nr:helix-turn-helix domain-containing protein [Ktedonosporobacter rubrisoli]QBD78752.1 TrmB family transcriptional regulator [Ktedonosporobacter rubrisoli]
MMSTVELLQQTGLNKYEAEAYYTLLMHGALTGYEVGKLSQVPLSRSYEILERLVEKGLALLQPGEPPRYSAQDPQQFLAKVRGEIEATLNALTISLAALPRPNTMNEFWVIRGEQNILSRLQAMIKAAQSTLLLTLPASVSTELAELLREADSRRCLIRQFSSADQRFLKAEGILLLRDNHEALLGSIGPEEPVQAIVSTNTALVAALNEYGQRALRQNNQAADSDWVAWETRKQRHLWDISKADRVA